MLSAHADTIGLAVYRIDRDGKIRFRSIGGINLATLDGESATIHTRDGRVYTGLILCQAHSTHVYFRYGSDANAVRKAGHDVRAALFGMAVLGSHGMERTHIDGLCNTTNLLLAYVLDI